MNNTDFLNIKDLFPLYCPRVSQPWEGFLMELLDKLMSHLDSRDNFRTQLPENFQIQNQGKKLNKNG